MMAVEWPWKCEIMKWPWSYIVYIFRKHGRGVTRHGNSEIKEK